MKTKFYTMPSRIFLEKLTAAILVLFFSFLISPFYTDGDQRVYRAVYEILPNLDLIEGYSFYTSQLSSKEYVHFLLSWVASSFVDKDLFIAFSNATFAYVAMSLFRKWKASVIISFIIILTNFYFLVLYFAAERLKFGFIFLTLSLIYVDQLKRFYVFATLAIISHAQVIIVYGSILFHALIRQILKLIRTREVPKSVFFLVPFLFIPPFLVGDHLLMKFQDYYGSGGLEALGRIFVFLLLALLYSKDRGETFAIFLPLFIAVFLVGGERVNIFGYFAFLYYGLRIRGGWNVGVLVTSAYYAYASIVFLVNVFQRGDGFISG